jgi:hypothetical protein
METAKSLQDTQKSFTTNGVVTIGMLIVQYILGMINNFYVKFPESAPVGKLWQFAFSQISEAAHIILGVLLFLGVLSFLIRVIIAKNRTWLIASAVGLAGIIISIFGGVSYIFTLVDFYSLIMSIGFLVAILAYGWGLYSAKS